MKRLIYLLPFLAGCVPIQDYNTVVAERDVARYDAEAARRQAHEALIKATEAKAAAAEANSRAEFAEEKAKTASGLHWMVACVVLSGVVLILLPFVVVLKDRAEKQKKIAHMVLTHHGLIEGTSNGN